MSINKVIRLGKRSTESDAKPRPVKLKLASEEQKHKLLKQTKKLDEIQGGSIRECVYTPGSHTKSEKKNGKNL